MFWQLELYHGNLVLNSLAAAQVLMGAHHKTIRILGWQALTSRLGSMALKGTLSLIKGVLGALGATVAQIGALRLITQGDSRGP